MGNGVIALLVAIGASAWIYAKLMKQTGNNTKSAVTGAALSAVCIFVILLLVLNAFIK